jgi:5-methyltetrahydropteroyltriglutamate--homocysteine methyltransferase
MDTAVAHAQAIGSLLRPAYLSEARERLAAGELSPAQYKRIEDRAVDEAIRLQEAAGLDVVTDGEMRRLTFMDHLLVTVPGHERVTAPPIEARDGDDSGAYQVTVPLAVTEPVRAERLLSVDEFCYARARSTRPVKIALPSPLTFWSFWSAERSREAYPDPFELFADWTEILRAEITELVRLGCEHIQIDAPDIAILVDPEQRQQREAMGISVERTLTEGIDLIDSLAAIPGAHVAMHLCKGNFRSMWAASGGYEWLAEKVFRRASHVRAFLLEYDDDRSGGFEPLKFLSATASVGLGLVSTKNEQLEPLDLLRERVHEAAKFVDLERVIVSPQCGFASVAAGANLVSRATQSAKLTRVAELAEAIWG